MELNYKEEVVNPGLVWAMQKMRENSSQENLNAMMEEAMTGKFLSPAVVQIQEEAGEEGKKQANVSFQLIDTTDERHFFMAFTDKMEMEKMQQEVQTVVVTFEELSEMVLNSGDAAAGFVINPFSENIMFETDMLKNLKANREQNS